MFVSILLRDRVVVTDNLQMFSISRRPGVAHVQAVVRAIIRAEPRESYAHRHGAMTADDAECGAGTRGGGFGRRGDAAARRESADGDQDVLKRARAGCALKMHTSQKTAAKTPP